MICRLPLIPLSLLVFFLLFGDANSQNVSFNPGADIVSRYVWRGLNLNNMPHIQPSITLKYKGLQGGFWGSYGLSHLNSGDDNYSYSEELDTWLSYTLDFKETGSFTLIATDYYYPNNGIRIGNFNDYDNSAGAGAHLIEAGLTYSGPESFPFSVSGYINVYNDKGSNMYFQADYLTSIQDVALDIFLGAAPGSKDNPAFYNTENFNIVNIGLKTSKQIKITADYSLPVSCTYVLNPRVEASYLIFGITF